MGGSRFTSAEVKRWMQNIAGAFLHLWQGEEFNLWSHIISQSYAQKSPQGVQANGDGIIAY
ncbi:hypothetical protein VEE59_30690 [Escherichia coli]|nr:hypothetical protein VEE59_30690 [Escherichia coli]